MSQPQSFLLAIVILLTSFTTPAWSESDDRELIQSIQRDLQALGHDVDDTSGRLTLQTRIAIGAVEEKYGMEATGEPSFDIAAKLRTELRAQQQAPSYTTSTPSQPQADPACLQARVDAKNTSKAKRIGSAAMRLLGRHGNRDVVEKAYEATRSAQDVAATTNDVKTISDELGLSQDEVNECMR